MPGAAAVGRAVAAIIAVVAWIGLATQFRASHAQLGDGLQVLWVMLRYFTVITNLLVAIVFSAIALDIRRLSTPFQLAGVTIAIMLVGVVYGLLLRGMVELSGGALLADTLNHVVTPILVPLYWVLLAPKGYVRARDPWLWTLLPLAYFAYALVRGASEGLYAYPFIDLPAIGWTQLLVNAAVMALGFIAAGHVLFWLDGRLSRTRPMVIG